MKWLGLMALLASLSACIRDQAPYAPVPSVCEDQVYADPVVKDLILKGSGSDYYRMTHEEQLKYAKIDAARRCMQQKGLAPPGGGVQRRAVTN